MSTENLMFVDILTTSLLVGIILRKDYFLFNFFAGRRIFHHLKSRNIRGDTGQVAFDDNGDRMYAEYDVINIREHQRKKIVGSLQYDEVISVCKQ